MIGIALQVAGAVATAGGNAAGLDQKAADAAVAARRGKIAAAETDTSIRQELSSVIGNIRAIRASSGIDPNSPTTAAIVANEGRVSERQRRISVGNIEAQAASDQNSSSFLRRSANNTFLFGSLGAFGQGASAYARSI